MNAPATIVDALTGTELPLTQPRTMLCAQPPGLPFFIAIGTTDRLEFYELLRRAGINPDNCIMGTMPFAGADFSVDWDRNVHVGAEA